MRNHVRCWMAVAVLIVLSLSLAPALSSQAALAASQVPTAPAQAQSAAVTRGPGGEMPPCDGVLAVIRLYEITPSGSVEKFLAATEAQRAWYAHHGMDDLIFASKVVVHDPATDTFSYSTKFVLNYHYYSTKPVPPHDAEWEAFVKAFAETAQIKEGPLTCIPREMVPAIGPK